MTTRRRQLTGQLVVQLPPAQAFRLFTPLGERDWAPGWEPHFPVPVDDDTEPGTTFETTEHGTTRTWQVIDREPGRHIRYATVAPGNRASIITVDLQPEDQDSAKSAVTVTYDVTALSDTGAHDLTRFAHAYQEYLLSWQEQITMCLTTP